ncbi:MAG: adenylosuccinate synthetase [Candidatus Aenigmarchaeota archaeon]|nr:adenylosuccinate synthetase [Candidatus Aenigmarchaeota archaeon]
MLHIVVGGFYGDEGKGKICAYLSMADDFDYVVRAGGGPQAGHTIFPGKSVRQVPCGVVNRRSRLLVSRGTLINPKILLKEMEEYDVGRRLQIDYRCTVIEQRHIEAEKELVERIGSVGAGTGYARADRVLRRAKLAQDVHELRPFLADVQKTVLGAIRGGKSVLVEGVHGYGLSLFNKRYPHVTSQDTTASQFAADVGIGPLDVGEVTVVFKAYTSRVGPGPMGKEWKEERLKKMGLSERGTVSGRPRRLGPFDKRLAAEAVQANSATQTAMTCVDRLFAGNEGVTEYEKLTDEAKLFLENIEQYVDRMRMKEIFSGIELISTGPEIENTIDRRAEMIQGTTDYQNDFPI